MRQILEVEMKGVPGKVKLYDVRGVAGPHGAYLIDRDETLSPVGAGIAVQVFRLDQKIMSGKGENARIAYASLTSAKVIFATRISAWEDIRMVVEQAPDTEVDCGNLRKGDLRNQHRGGLRRARTFYVCVFRRI